MRLTLEFVPRGLSWRYWLPALLALIAAGWMATEYATEAATVRAQAARVAELEARLGRIQRDRDAAARETPEQARRRAAWLALASELRYPWQHVLATLEQAQMPDVAVLAFSHAQAGQGGELVVVAREARAINDYVEQLNGDGGQATRWYVASLQPERQGGAPAVRAVIRHLNK